MLTLQFLSKCLQNFHFFNINITNSEKKKKMGRNAKQYNLIFRFFQPSKIGALKYHLSKIWSTEKSQQIFDDLYINLKSTGQCNYSFI